MSGSSHPVNVTKTDPVANAALNAAPNGIPPFNTVGKTVGETVEEIAGETDATEVVLGDGVGL